MKDQFEGLSISKAGKGVWFDEYEVRSEKTKNGVSTFDYFLVGTDIRKEGFSCTCVFGSWFGQSKKNLKEGKNCRHIKFVQKQKGGGKNEL